MPKELRSEDDADEDDDPAPPSSATPKTREDFLLENEKRLVDATKDLHKSIDKKLASVYIISFTMVLLVTGVLSKFSLAGAEFNTDSINLVITFSSIIMIALYIMILYQIIILFLVYDNLDDNSEIIAKENPRYIPANSFSIRFSSSSVLSLLLYGSGTIRYRAEEELQSINSELYKRANRSKTYIVQMKQMLTMFLVTIIFSIPIGAIIYIDIYALLYHLELSSILVVLTGLFLMLLMILSPSIFHDYHEKYIARFIDAKDLFILRRTGLWTNSLRPIGHRRVTAVDRKRPYA